MSIPSLTAPSALAAPAASVAPATSAASATQTAQTALAPGVRQKMDMDALRGRLSPAPDKDKKLKDACEGFESVFIGQMIKEMRKTVPKDGYFKGKEEEQYVSMFDEELSKKLAKSGGIGLADYMMRQLATRADQTQQTQASSAALSGAQRTTALSSLPTRADGFKKITTISAGSDIHSTPGMGPRGIAPGGSLDGTPSQHLGTPGAQYLQGKDQALAAPLASQLVAPVDGEISSEFGWRRDPFTGQRGWHSGIDIAAPEGTPVKACLNGQVTFAGKRNGYGNLIVVDHSGGLQSYYGHNKAINVTEGQAVRAGQQIAAVGHTGRATGPHLHFEIRRNDVAVDPMKAGGPTLAALGQDVR